MKRFLLALAALALLFGLVSAPFYIFAKIASEEIQRRRLSEAEHNSLKHGFAAAELYARLRPILGADTAENVTVWTGETVERIEQIVNHETDVAREVYKDLYNNLYGVEAARWMETAGGSSDVESRLKLLGWLAETNALADWAEDKRIPDSLPWTPDIDAAIAASRADRARLEAQFRAWLTAHRRDIAADLSLK
ncbi:hypothetical protein IZ6_04710 [Terrihabitans soli]|uniref:Uncharacterized protein n=1 Tax=Terrihabitans soli TaxID=708113 RepID=A0A6S6QKF5_9HYPH|nr:hypothetical protein [Terrihabitans soli]BCJ89736.1 hypothetical protein IZ6_04710 [Terrihabitans soli]